MELEPDEFDMWEYFKVPFGGYNSLIDEIFIEVMKSYYDHYPDFYSTEIAKRLECDPSLVELMQYILCSSSLWEYGTSPRGCFPIDDEKCKELIKKCEDYYKRKWIDEE